MAALVLLHTTVQADLTDHALRTYPGSKIKAYMSAAQ